MDVREKLVELLDGMFNGGGCVDKADAADYLIANGVTIQQWISVEESFPESEGFYLTCRKKEVMVTWYGSGSLWKYIWDHDVDFWMPLPEVPI